MAETSDDAIDRVVDIVCGLIAAPTRFFLDPFVLLMGWRWFVVPMGAPNVTYLHMIGLDLLIGTVLAMAHPPTIKSEFATAKTGVWSLAKVVVIAIFLGVMAIIHMLMGGA